MTILFLRITIIHYECVFKLFSVYCTDGSDISGQTGILLPQQTVSLHFSSQQNKSYVTLTGDSRVVDVELVAKWLETLRRMYTMP